MVIRPVGANALLIDLHDAAATDVAAAVEAWRAELWRRRGVGEFTATDIVPGARTVLVDGIDDPAALAARLPRWAPRVGTGSAPGPLVEIPTVYGGPDLADVAARWGLTVHDAVARHAATEFRVAFCGFSPGFGYLTGLPPEFAVPRLATPRTRVPAGSVALADTWCGVYPSASPGGWRLIGHTGITLFDATAEPPALLAPGTRVRFVPVAG